MPAKAALLSTKAWLRGPSVRNQMVLTGSLKRLQKRSIDDSLRQLVSIRQDRVLVNLSTSFFTSDSEFFFFLLFQKKMGRSSDGKRNILWGWPYAVVGKHYRNN